MKLKFLTSLLWREDFSEGGVYPSTKIWLKHWLIQKILRFNGRVPWPVHPSTKINAPEKIVRGTRTPGLSRGCHIDGRNGIIFGNNVWIGPHVKIISMNHHPCDYNRYIEESAIVIGDNCWIGAGAIILPGVNLGAHTIVGAGSIVTKSFPGSDQVVAGNPASFVKNIDAYSGA